MATIGKVNDIPIEHDIEWKILNFSSLSIEKGTFYCSSPFSFAGESWYLNIYPNGHRVSNSAGYISLYLAKKSSGCPITLEYSLGLKTVNGKKDSVHHLTRTFRELEDGFGVPKCLLRSKLFERQSVLLPDDVLTVFCNLKYPKSAEKPSVNCTSVSSAVVNHENKVLQDLKAFYLKKEDCDVILKVKSQEFPAHSAILRARSPVFASTYRYDTKEKATGIIDIEDCEPSSFSDFLLFLYCGDINIISAENVYSLFTVGDKYNVQDLREKCVKFMKENLSVDTFCDTITLALQHSEIQLITLVSDFFTNHALEIVKTDLWQSFLVSNPTQSNELFMKALAAAKGSNE